MSIPKLSQPNHIHLNQICQLTCQGLYFPFCYSPSLWCLSSCLSQEEWGAPSHCCWRSATSLDFQVPLLCSSLSSFCPPRSFTTGSECQVNVKGGCEAVIHSVSQLMSSGQPDQQWVLLLDFTNAFNTINRFSIFEEFRAHIPGLSAWMESCYSGQPFLHLGSQTILSCCGVQQGDPLGPLGFALTLHPIVERIRAAVPNLTLNAWYLDDGILVGSSRDIAAALNIIESDGPPVGLNLNRAKSLLFIPEDADASCSPLPPEIPITQRGFTLLGCPIAPLALPLSVKRSFSAVWRK